MRGNWGGSGGGLPTDLVSEVLSVVPTPAWIIKVRPERRLERANAAGQQRLLDAPDHLEPVILALALGAPLPEPFDGGPLLDHGDDRWVLVVEAAVKANLQERLRNEWQLTVRQAEVTALVLEGFSNKEISERLHASVRTVEVHVSAVLRRTNSASRSELIALFFRDGARPPRMPGGLGGGRK